MMSATHRFNRNVLVGVRAFCTVDMTIITMLLAGMARQNIIALASIMMTFSGVL